MGASSAGPASRDPGLGWGPSIQRGTSEVSGWGVSQGLGSLQWSPSWLPGCCPDLVGWALQDHRKRGRGTCAGLVVPASVVGKDRRCLPGHPVAPQWLLLSLEPMDQILTHKVGGGRAGNPGCIWGQVVSTEGSGCTVPSAETLPPQRHPSPKAGAIIRDSLLGVISTAGQASSATSTAPA